MAKLVGNLPLDYSENLVVKNLLSQLPDDAIVIPHVVWTLENKDGFVSDGEADVVALIPNMGMVVFEVKGSREFWVEEGRWYRDVPGSSPCVVNPSPADQCMGNMHELVRIICHRLGWLEFPGRYSYLVAYPRGEALRLPAMFDESTLITNRHRNMYSKRCRDALERRGYSRRALEFTYSRVDEVVGVLTSRDFRIVPADTPSDVRNDIAAIDTLTAQQVAFLRIVLDLKKVAVTGPAGSGKTVLAMWRLTQLVSQGNRALYVCFNLKLAETLRDKYPQCSDCIVSVDKFLLGWVKKKQKAVRPGADTEVFFREQLPSYVVVHPPESDAERYDAIIIDEGQDFGEVRLLALMELLKQNGQWLFFSDRRQNIYRINEEEAAGVGAEVLFSLEYNCRNTVAINAATNRICDSSVKPMPGLPDGMEPKIVACASRSAMADLAWKTARDWIDGGGSVAILSPFTLNNSSMRGAIKGHGLDLVEEIALLGEKNTVVFSTIKSFKGIEADGVIVIDVDMPGSHSYFTNEDLYVACTRPKARLALFAHDIEVVNFLLGSPGKL